MVYTQDFVKQALKNIEEQYFSDDYTWTHDFKTEVFAALVEEFGMKPELGEQVMIYTKDFAVEIVKAMIEIQEKYFTDCTLQECIEEIQTIVNGYDPEWLD
jgi:hypothetical protein